jgi:hypothetical protein
MPRPKPLTGGQKLCHQDWTRINKFPTKTYVNINIILIPYINISFVRQTCLAPTKQLKLGVADR